MNNNPRLGFFDVDPEKFSAMLDEMTREKVVIPMNEVWNEDYDGLIDVESFGEMIEDFHEDDYYDDSMDGDFDSAKRDAGFGTDEDYGYYGEDY